MRMAADGGPWMAGWDGESFQSCSSISSPSDGMPGVQFELPLQVGQQDAPMERRRRRGAGTAVYGSMVGQLLGQALQE